MNQEDKQFTFTAHSFNWRKQATTGDIITTFSTDSSLQQSLAPLILIEHGKQLEITVRVIE